MWVSFNALSVFDVGVKNLTNFHFMQTCMHENNIKLR